MKRILKLLGIVVAVLAAAVVILAIFFLNPILESAKPSIEKTIAKAIQTPVTFGPVEVSAFPSPRIKLSDLKIGGGTKGFNLGTLTLNCRLLPLLKGTIQVAKIELSSASLAVEKDAHGKLIIGGVDLSKLQDPNKAGKQTADEANTTPLDLSIEELALENIDVIYTDATHTPPLNISVTNLELNASGISPTGANSFKVTGALLNPQHQNFSLSGAVQLDKLTKLPNGDVTFVLQAFELESTAPLIEVFAPDLKDKLTVKGPLDGSIHLKLAGLKSDYEIKVRGNRADITLKDALTKKAGVEFSADAAGSAAANGILNISKAEMSLGESKIGGSVADLNSKGQLSSAKLLLSLTDLKQLATILPGLAKLSPTGQVTGEINLRSKDAALNIESGNLKGSDLSMSKDGQPMINGGSFVMDLTPTKIDLTEFAATAKGESINLNGEITPSVLANVARKIGLHSKSLLGGSMELGIDYDPANSSVQSKLQVGGIPLVRAAAAAGVSDALGITGTIERVAVDSSLRTNDPNSMSAVVSGTLANGSILKFNLLAEIFKALNQIPGLGIQSGEISEADATTKANGTAFDSLKLVSKINGDNINLESLNLTHQLYLLNGSGDINLKGGAKISCEVIFPASFAEKLTAKSEKFKYVLNSDGSISVPVVILRQDGSTPWLVLPDVKKLGEKLFKGAGKEAVKEKGSKLLDKVSPGLGSSLKKLF